MINTQNRYDSLRTSLVDCGDDEYEEENVVPKPSKQQRTKRSRENHVDVVSSNPFNALRFESNARREIDELVTEDEIEDHLKKSKLPVRPGLMSYAESVVTEEQKVMIFTTSISKNIRLNDFNKHVKSGPAYFRRFHGAKARHMKNYIVSHLEEEKPDAVLIHGGGNDLPTSRKKPLPVADIANDLIAAAQTCKLYGVENIMVSSVLPRKTPYMNERCKELNRLLRIMCELYGFTFADHEGYITTRHLSKDGVHLNEDGSCQLARDYLYYINEN